MNFAGDACQQFIAVLKTNDRLSDTFGWMFNSDGTISTLFYNEMNRWIYQNLPSSGSNGAYAVTSNPLYAKPLTLTDNALGRMVWFIANHASPEDTVGSTLTVDAAAPVPITDRFGAAIKKGAIKSGAMVGVVNDGTAYRVITPMGQTSIADLEPGPDLSYLRSFTVGADQVAQWHNDYTTADVDLQPIPTPGTPVTFGHSLGVKPRFWGVNLVCITTDLGYAAGDEVSAYSVIAHGATDDDYTPAIMANAAMIRFCQGLGETALRFASKAIPAPAANVSINPANWKLRAWAIR
jgi:hypothetical protein